MAYNGICKVAYIFSLIFRHSPMQSLLQATSLITAFPFPLISVCLGFANAVPSVLKIFFYFFFFLLANFYFFKHHLFLSTQRLPYACSGIPTLASHVNSIIALSIAFFVLTVDYFSVCCTRL